MNNYIPFTHLKSTDSFFAGNSAMIISFSTLVKKREEPDYSNNKLQLIAAGVCYNNGKCSSIQCDPHFTIINLYWLQCKQFAPFKNNTAQ
jgi:hypothetical protein